MGQLKCRDCGSSDLFKQGAALCKLCYYKEAAEQGHADAQFQLGRLYDLGRGVPQDDTKAAFWYQKAADQGHEDAKDELFELQLMSDPSTKAALQFSMGMGYLEGKGVSQDYAKAAELFRLAAAQGHEEAKNHLNKLQSKKKPFEIHKSRKVGGGGSMHILISAHNCDRTSP